MQHALDTALRVDARTRPAGETDVVAEKLARLVLTSITPLNPFWSLNSMKRSDSTHGAFAGLKPASVMSQR